MSSTKLGRLPLFGFSHLLAATLSRRLVHLVFNLTTPVSQTLYAYNMVHPSYLISPGDHKQNLVMADLLVRAKHLLSLTSCQSVLNMKPGQEEKLMDFFSSVSIHRTLVSFLFACEFTWELLTRISDVSCLFAGFARSFRGPKSDALCVQSFSYFQLPGPFRARQVS